MSKMSKSSIIMFSILGAFILFGVGSCSWGLGVYRNIVVSNQAAEASWGDVQNAYQRRADLIPSLVETVKGAAKFERETFTAVTEARASAGKISVDMKNAPATMEELQKFQEAQRGLSQAMSRLMVVHERYPELKANANFIALQAELAGTENRIAVERRKFNASVQSYNGYIVVPPGSFLASFFNFKTRPYFKADEGAAVAPKIQF